MSFKESKTAPWLQSKLQLAATAISLALHSSMHHRWRSLVGSLGLGLEMPNFPRKKLNELFREAGLLLEGVDGPDQYIEA